MTGGWLEIEGRAKACGTRAYPEPWMNGRLHRCHARDRIPRQTALEKVHKIVMWLVLAKEITQGPRSGWSDEPVVCQLHRFRAVFRRAVLREMHGKHIFALGTRRQGPESGLLTLFAHAGRRHAETLHHSGQHDLLIAPSEKWWPQSDLGQNAAKGPHVDRETVGKTCGYNGGDDFIIAPINQSINQSIHKLIDRSVGQAIPLLFNQQMHSLMAQ